MTVSSPVRCKKSLPGPYVLGPTTVPVPGVSPTLRPPTTFPPDGEVRLLFEDFRSVVTVSREGQVSRIINETDSPGTRRAINTEDL